MRIMPSIQRRSGRLVEQTWVIADQNIGQTGPADSFAYAMPMIAGDLWHDVELDFSWSLLVRPFAFSRDNIHNSHLFFYRAANTC